jgi:hypothetical protein
MFAALLILAQSAEPAAPARGSQARVSLRIHKAVQASESEWRKAPAANRRELERKDEDGRAVVIRVIEHQ